MYHSLEMFSSFYNLFCVKKLLPKNKKGRTLKMHNWILIHILSVTNLEIQRYSTEMTELAAT